MQPLVQAGDRVLFQGDSITDAERNRRDPDHLGCGYAMMAASWFQALYPESRVSFLNRAVSGDRAKDLLARWQKDCLNLRPSLLSILVGINETWRRYDSNDATSAAAYESAYRSLLVQARAKFPEIRLILCKPFVLPVSAEQERWRVDLDPKIAVVQKLAGEFQALLVPFDTAFAQAATRREPAFWAADGVHPTSAGHALMAQTWLKAVQALTLHSDP